MLHALLNMYMYKLNYHKIICELKDRPILMYCTIMIDKPTLKGHYICYQSRLKEYRSSSGDEKLKSLSHKAGSRLIRPFYIENSVGRDFIWSHKTGSR